MKLAVIASLLLCSGLVYDFALRPEHATSNGTKVTSNIKFLWPKVRRFVDTHAIITAAAKKHKVPPAFVRSIMAAESAFDPDVVSPKGAIGLMQLMPETAQEYGADPTIPEQNVDAGAAYLRVLLTRYKKYHNGMARAIAAYNAGPGVVDKYRGVPPYKETRGYVTRVMKFFKKFQKEQA